MKIFVLTLMLATLSAGLATAGGGYGYNNCANNNSRACRDARDAFASHHGGAFPNQYRQRHAYNDNRGYWNDRGGDREWRHESHERHEHHHGHHDRD